MAEASVLDRPNIHRTRVGLKVPEVTPNVGSSGRGEMGCPAQLDRCDSEQDREQQQKAGRN